MHAGGPLDVLPSLPDGRPRAGLLVDALHRVDTAARDELDV